MTPLLWPSRCVFLVLQGCPTGGLGPTLLDAGFLYCVLSASSLDPKLHRGSRGPPRSGVAFPTTSSLQLSGTLLATPLAPWTSNSNRNRNSIQLARRTQLSYIIVRRPLDLWNRMFNRHQAEITVMQFTGHSLPVHQSMSVPWESFCSSHFISQFPPTWFPHITAIGMCHFLPVHHFEWHFGQGQKVKTQQYFSCLFSPFSQLSSCDMAFHKEDIRFAIGVLALTSLFSRLIVIIPLIAVTVGTVQVYSCVFGYFNIWNIPFNDICPLSFWHEFPQLRSSACPTCYAFFDFSNNPGLQCSDIFKLSGSIGYNTFIIWICYSNFPFLCSAEVQSDSKY